MSAKRKRKTLKLRRRNQSAKQDPVFGGNALTDLENVCRLRESFKPLKPMRVREYREYVYNGPEDDQ
jgi:hypothetical protein